MDYDYTREAFETAYICKMFHNVGRLEKLPHTLPVDRDSLSSVQCDALENITDYFHSKFFESDYHQKYYYQDPAMTEYYQLCGEYNKRRRTRMDENPYHQKAAAFVLDTLSMIDDAFRYAIQTKTNHVWSCRLTVEVAIEYFYDYTGLVSALLDIFSFYRNQVAVLRADLQEESKKEAA